MSAEPGASSTFAAWWSGRRAAGRRILFVTHDTGRSGAPLILLELAKRWLRKEDADARILALAGGDAAALFSAVAPLLVQDEQIADRDVALEALGKVFEAAPPDLAICNTMQSEPTATLLARMGVPIVALVHEQVHTIDLLYSRESLARFVEAAGVVVLPSVAALEDVVTSYAMPPERFIVRPQGSRIAPRAADVSREASRAAVLTPIFGPSPDAKLVVGCGTVSMRKGFDIFVQVAQRVAARRGIDVRFVWAGDEDPNCLSWCLYDVRRLGLGSVLRWVGQLDDPSDLIGAADVFLLPSREDPFPMVVLEALTLGVPVVAFRSAGGAPEAIGADAGFSVPYLDVDAMAGAVAALLTEPALHERVAAGARLAGARYDFDVYTDAIRELATKARPVRGGRS